MLNIQHCPPAVKAWGRCNRVRLGRARGGSVGRAEDACRLAPRSRGGAPRPGSAAGLRGAGYRMIGMGQGHGLPPLPDSARAAHALTWGSGFLTASSSAWCASGASILPTAHMAARRTTRRGGPR